MAKKERTAAELIAAIKRREATVKICLSDNLNARHEELEGQLVEAQHITPTSLADEDPAVPIAQEIRALEAEMKDESTEILFRAMARPKYDALQLAHPGRPDKQESLNMSTFPDALIVQTWAEPAMTEIEIRGFLDELSQGVWDVLFQAAYTVNNEGSSVPHSARASVVIQSREQK